MIPTRFCGHALVGNQAMDGTCQARDNAGPVWNRLGAYYVPLLAVAVLAGMSFRFLQFSRTSDWGKCLVPAALCLADRDGLPGLYAYPPAMAMLTLPLARLPVLEGDVAWYFINVLAACIAFTCAWRLAGGPGLTQLSGRWHAVLALSLVLGGRFFVSPLENTQFDMIIACLLLAGCCRLWQGRDWSSGLLLGASSAMKCTPLLFLPYLLWRRRWRAALLMSATFLLLNLLPDLLWPQRSGTLYLVDWYRNTLRPLESHAPGVWHTGIAFNQSLGGLFNRWVAYGWPLSESQIAQFIEVPDHLIPVVRCLTWGTAAVLLGLTAWRLGRPFQSLPTHSSARSHSVGGFLRNPLPVSERPAYTARSSPIAWTEMQPGIEAGLGVCLMLLLSPMSGKSHYVVMILPAMLMARRVIEQPHPGSIVLACCLVVTGPLCATDLVGDALADLTLFWGFPTLFVLLCFGGLWWLHGVAARTRL
jgi:hypothetical protein